MQQRRSSQDPEPIPMTAKKLTVSGCWCTVLETCKCHHENLKSFTPQYTCCENQESLTPQFSTQKDYSTQNWRAQKQNKWKWIGKKLTRDHGEWPKSQKTQKVLWVPSYASRSCPRNLQRVSSGPISSPKLSNNKIISKAQYCSFSWEREVSAPSSTIKFSIFLCSW